MSTDPEQPRPRRRTRRTEDVTATKGSDFTDWGLKEELLAGIYEMGYDNPSPIQEEVIPLALYEHDIIARAKNGTGKTASYLIPMLELVDVSISTPQVLILLPTQELALQTAQVCKALGKHIEGLQVMCCIGGTNAREDVLRLQQAVHIMIGSPGRMHDFICSRGVVDTSRVFCLCCDEADKLLAPSSFLPLVENILNVLPPERQIMLLSASFPHQIQRFKRHMKENTKEISVMSELTLRGVTQYYAYINETQKLQVLYHLMSKLQIDSCVIFCNSNRRVELLAQKLTELGFSAFYSHSGLAKEERRKVFADFRAGTIRTLVCSDLFSRGVDAPVNVIVNFDFPGNAATYLHRIGRSGRYGRHGVAINFITEGQNTRALIYIEGALKTEILPLPAEIDPSLYCQYEEDSEPELDEP